MTPPNDAVAVLRRYAETIPQHPVYDGPIHLTRPTARAILAHIATLTAERNAAEARADAERAKVVAWLREADPWHGADPHAANYFAKRIEQGAHHDHG